MKTCSKCKEEKDLSEFPKHHATWDGLHAHCKECKYKQNREYIKQNPERNRSKAKRWQKKMMSQGRCFICGEPSVTKYRCETHRLYANRKASERYYEQKNSNTI